ncbi:MULTISPECIES: DUF3533 domain-containing protein [unclassified Paenibacillus]|uniref:YhgE/Pip domain-containing protein n=1 Tax=unclassified Paenibacillus TaxID=185978 RepID=UPI000956D593|nr:MULTISPECIES: DUF3533 domain-containing protein [unclassified Paenibacillus]ASS69009.1 DUF3533 domain-containing protein [Paenibacillus sp. RUD330]SIR10850.1 YhgE/Pip N-terminal domain-containing protein [Paenibacillus sp. RU4X]SIR25922.1 YhgE/Pip N-terminal domain-containing protein [Paenibacillus sp. RU4T]
MNLFKNKLAIMAPIIAFLVIFIFSLTLFPSVKVQPKNLPIAIVNEDQGVEAAGQTIHMGQTIIETVKKSSSSASGESPAVKWVEVKSAEEVREGLNNQKYYGALVIPQDFSAKQASLRTAAPASPEVEIFINQGMNTAASTMAGQILNGIVDNINTNVRTQALEGFKSQGSTLTVEQASSLVNPITKKVTNVNEIGTKSANGNAPISLFQPLWMASLVCAAILFMVVSKTRTTSRAEKFTLVLMQIVIGAVSALVVGFGLTWLAESMIGFHIPSFTDTALFLTITFFSYYLLISAVVSWLGFKGIPIFALLLFFGAPLLALAPEMMSAFYHDYIYSWLPMRFMVQGLRELFFFGKGLSWSSSVSTLVWIGLASSALLLLSALKPQRGQELQNQNG